MNFFYFLDRYFDNLDDFKFQLKWRKYFHDHLNRVVSLLFFFWILLLIFFGAIFIELTGILFGLVITIFFSGYLAYILIFQFLKFLAKHNTRYIQSGIFDEGNTFNHEDVVETFKKK